MFLLNLRTQLAVLLMLLVGLTWAGPGKSIAQKTVRVASERGEVTILSRHSNATDTNDEDFSRWKEVAPSRSGFSIKFPGLPNHIPSTMVVPDVETYLIRHRAITYSLTIKIDGPMTA